MTADENLAEKPCRNRAYNMIMQQYLLRYYKGKKVTELLCKFTSVTQLTEITLILLAYLNNSLCTKKVD